MAPDRVCLRKLLEGVLHKNEGISYEERRLRVLKVWSNMEIPRITPKGGPRTTSLEQEDGDFRQNVSRKEWNKEIPWFKFGQVKKKTVLRGIV